MLTAPSAGAQAQPPRPSGERLFVSGHSLTDQPLPYDLAAISSSLGTPLQWNRQYKPGSSIRERVRGSAAGDNEEGWRGFHEGANREGMNMDVLAELRQPRTVSGGRYGLLLITESHDLLGTLQWNHTVRYMRHYHERFIEANPAGRTYFYEPWLGIDNKDDPRRWIAYERAASPVWQCVATRINLSLAAEGRADRIVSLPAGLAMAGLVERATQGPGVPGLSGASVRETLNRLFTDDVHLTRLGTYYMALVSYASVFARSPVGAWVPAEIDATLARLLQGLAWQQVSDYQATNRALTLAECRAHLQGSFIHTYWRYMRDTRWSPDVGATLAHLRAWRHGLTTRWRFWRDDEDNPFHYDAASDRSYWLPAP